MGGGGVSTTANSEGCYGLRGGLPDFEYVVLARRSAVTQRTTHTGSARWGGQLKASNAVLENVAKGGVLQAPFQAAELQPPTSLNPRTLPQLCSMLFTYELARRLEQAGSSVTCNCLDPGPPWPCHVASTLHALRCALHVALIANLPLPALPCMQGLSTPRCSTPAGAPSA